MLFFCSVQFFASLSMPTFLQESPPFSLFTSCLRGKRSSQSQIIQLEHVLCFTGERAAEFGIGTFYLTDQRPGAAFRRYVRRPHLALEDARLRCGRPSSRFRRWRPFWPFQNFSATTCSIMMPLDLHFETMEDGHPEERSARRTQAITEQYANASMPDNQ